MKASPSTHALSTEQSILTKLIINNSDLEQLEKMLSRFNLFEAIGVVRQELKHSSLLAFLLSPSEQHGLGDRFLKAIMSSALSYLQSPFSALAIDLADLSDVEVRREWRHIDILIYSPSNKWVVSIENKVDSSEHSNQLKRYEDVIEAEFRDYKKKAFIYLTKEGEEASRKKWRSLSYSVIADTLEETVAKYESYVDEDVQTLCKHYIHLIRRHIVSNSEIAQLCRKIYKQHRQALDLIYEHRPDLQTEIADYLKQIIEETDGIELEDSNKFFIRCVPTVWDKAPQQKRCGATWTQSNRIALIEFFNYPNNKLELKLTIGPGEFEDKSAIFNAIKPCEISGWINSKLKPDKWSHIFSQNVLTSSDYFEEDWKDIQSKILRFWKIFQDREIKQMNAAIASLEP